MLQCRDIDSECKQSDNLNYRRPISMSKYFYWEGVVQPKCDSTYNFLTVFIRFCVTGGRMGLKIVAMNFFVILMTIYLYATGCESGVYEMSTVPRRRVLNFFFELFYSKILIPNVTF